MSGTANTKSTVDGAPGGSIQIHFVDSAERDSDAARLIARRNAAQQRRSLRAVLGSRSVSSARALHGHGRGNHRVENIRTVANRFDSVPLLSQFQITDLIRYVRQ
jgi:hypothetical protein